MIAPAGSLELTYSYDAQGRVVRRSAQPSSPIRIGATYEYDPRTGLLAKRVEDWNSRGAVTSTFVYDAKRRPARITIVLGVRAAANANRNAAPVVSGHGARGAA